MTDKSGMTTPADRRDQDLVQVKLSDLKLVLPRVEQQITLTWDEIAAVKRLREQAGEQDPREISR